MPWRDNGRGDQWAWLRRRWEAFLPDATIIEADSAGGSFSAAEAVNRGVSRARDGIVVLAWADTTVKREWIDATLRYADFGRVAAVAPRVCCRMGLWATTDLIEEPADAVLPAADGPSIDERRPLGWPGVAVTTRRVLAEVPFDERFGGCDFEGAAWLNAVATVCKPVEMAGEAYHLWHREPAGWWESYGGHERAKLFERYSKANGDPDAMAEVLADLRSSMGVACR